MHVILIYMPLFILCAVFLSSSHCLSVSLCVGLSGLLLQDYCCHYLCLQKYSLFKNYKKPFTLSYKDNFGYWPGVELARRFLLLLALVYFPRNTVSTL